MIIKKKDLKKGDFNIISTEFLKLKISKRIFFTNLEFLSALTIIRVYYSIHVHYPFFYCKTLNKNRKIVKKIDCLTESESRLIF